MGVQTRTNLDRPQYFLGGDHKYIKETLAQSGVGATEASITDGATYPVSISGLTLGITVGDGAEQTLTGGAQTTVDQVAAMINTQIEGVSATVDTGHVVVTTDDEGQDASIQVTTAGTLNAELVFPTTKAVGTGIDSEGLELLTVMVRDPSTGKIQPMTSLASDAGLSIPCGLSGASVTATEWLADDVDDLPLIVQADAVNEDLVKLKNGLTLDDVITGTATFTQNITIRHALMNLGIYFQKTVECSAYENA